jgi:ubiquinone/menaquinone biosynthesis C-methylase UbiE
MIAHVVEWLELRRRQVVLRQVQGRYLDVGCGRNRIVQDYRKSAGGAGVGVDIFQFGGADMIMEDTSRLPFQAESFDTISFVACLNHIPNRREVMLEAHRLLKPGGRLLITMISQGLGKVWHHVIRRWDEDQKVRGMNDGELWGISSTRVKNLIAEAGFGFIDHQRFVCGLNNLYISEKR